MLSEALCSFSGAFRLVSGFLGFLETNFAKLLEMRSFFPLYIILGVGKQQDLQNEFCQTLEMLLPSSSSPK
jgi:hypothetical protein